MYRERNPYQTRVAAFMQDIRQGQKSGDPDMNLERLYQKFLSTKQEPIRMAAALYGYFHWKDLSAARCQELERYLRSHVRNAVEALIEQDEPEKIRVFHQKGWFGCQELDSFLKIARERQKTQALVILLQLKKEYYGFPEKEYLF